MNCMLTAVGFLMLLIIVVLLLTGKVSLPPIFVVVPVVACLICGFGLAQINDFIGTGLKSVLNTVALFTFAVLYFSILNDVGMFDVIAVSYTHLDVYKRQLCLRRFHRSEENCSDCGGQPSWNHPAQSVKPGIPLQPASS